MKNINEDNKVKVLIKKDSKKAFRGNFGMLKGKLKKSSQEMKDELRRELY